MKCYLLLGGIGCNQRYGQVVINPQIQWSNESNTTKDQPCVSAWCIIICPVSKRQYDVILGGMSTV